MLAGSAAAFSVAPAGIALVRTARVRAWASLTVACADILLALLGLGLAAVWVLIAAVGVSFADGVPIH